MKCDTTAINFPNKKLKDVIVGDVFAFYCPSGAPCSRITTDTDRNTFWVLQLYHNVFYEPRPEDMEEDVFMLDAVVSISMLPRKK